MSRRNFAPALLVFGFLATSSLNAALDGSISGVVRDASASPLPGVGVSVTSPVLQGSRAAATRADGTYRFVGLPPGKGYKVVFALSGFTAVEVPGLIVSVDGDTQANAVLQVAAVSAAEGVVAEAPIVDITKTNTSQSMPADYLRKLTIGSGGRDYLAVIAQTPGASGTGNSNVNGGNLMENSFTIDGINTTDPVTHTFTFNLNFDAIQEVSVQTSGYSAEYGRATGGLVNVVTKSGGNEIHATLDGRYSTNKFSENGDFFDRSTTPARNIDAAATLGGPVLKDALWYALNAERIDNFVTPSTTNATILAQNPSPPSRGFKGWNTGAKLSFTATPQFNGFFTFLDSRADVPGSTNSVLYRPEAAANSNQNTRIYDVKLNGIFSSNLLGEVQGGRFEDFLETAPVNDIAISRWNNRTGGGVYYDNYQNYQASDRNRNFAGGSLAWFLENLAGNHQIKGGIDADKTFFPSTNFTTGTPTDPTFCPAGKTCGATFLFNGFDAAGNRIPFQQTVTERTPWSTATGTSYSAYLRDEWRPGSRLTLNLGLRWDRSNIYNDAQTRVIAFDKVQPRISAAYDILGDGKNVVRANYGHFYIDQGLTLVRNLNEAAFSPVSRTFRWNATAQRWTLFSQTGGGQLAAELVDPNLKATYDRQFSFAFEREIFRGASLSFTYLNKKTNDIFEDSCTDQATCDNFVITNNPGADLGFQNLLAKSYSSYTVQVQYRFTRGLVNAYYQYSHSKGSIDSSDGQYYGTDFDIYPDNFVNHYGYLSDDAPNRFRVFGSYLVPKIETRVSLNYTYRSGLPYNVTTAAPSGNGAQFVEPRGTSRTAVLHVLNMELEKQIPLPVLNGLSVSVIGSIFNVLNSEQALSYGTSIDSPSTVHQPLTYQRPRNYQIGLRAEF
jgi:outer membrane receptor protein involved in Fe transport